MQHVAIVGGGAVGSSVACFLARHPRFTGRITVIERDPTYARASTTLSASSIRQQFSNPVNIELSMFGISFLRNVGTELAVGGERPDITLHEAGYLFLASPEGLPVLRENHRLQCEHGADIALLSPAELVAQFPWISAEGIAGACFGRTGEGWYDGYALLQAYRRHARAHGVEYVTQEVVACTREGPRITALRLGDGATIACDTVVNAAGPWAGAVAAMMGIDLPVRPRRRMVFVIACRDRLPRCPLVIDPTGIWFRPEGPGFICGRSPWPGEEDPDEPPLTVDEAQFTDSIWPVLAERVPAFEAVKLTGSWAGYYEFNTFDHNGIVGPHPALENVIFANGFSGHGLQQSPGVGRGVAELIADGGYRTLDLSPLGVTRLLEGRKLLERNIV